jgi:hypothetical protein
MSETNTVRIILKRCRTGGHGELLSEEYKTVEISSQEIERLIFSDSFFGPYSVVGAELIDPELTEKKFKTEEIDF